MTTKDLRITYHCQVKDSPFDEQLKIRITDCNHNDIFLYISYLEETILELKKAKEEKK